MLTQLALLAVVISLFLLDAKSLSLILPDVVVLRNTFIESWRVHEQVIVVVLPQLIKLDFAFISKNLNIVTKH